MAIKPTDCTMCRHCQSFNYSYGCRKKGKILTTTDLENPGPCFEPAAPGLNKLNEIFEQFGGDRK